MVGGGTWIHTVTVRTKTMSLEHDAEAEESAPEEPLAETAGDTDTETESVEPTEEVEYSGLSRRGMLLSGGLLGLLGLGVGSASADASGQIGTANDPLKTLHVNKIEGGVVVDANTADEPLTSFTGGNLEVDNNGNLITEGGADPISVNDDDTLVQDSSNKEFSATDSVILGKNNELGASNEAAVCIGEGADSKGNGSVSIGGNNINLTATGDGSVSIGGGNKTNTGQNSVAIGGKDLTIANASNAFVTGEENSVADGADYSFVAGHGGKTTASHSFIWAGAANENNFNPRLENSTAGKVLFNATGGFEIISNDDGTTDSAPNPLLDVAGNIKCVGLTETSSLRYKSNVRPPTTLSPGVLNLEPKEYERKQTGETEIGLIAEEVDEILPELVKYNEDDEPDAVNYSRVGMFLAPEVSENRDRLETVEAAREECEETIETLEVELDAKDARVADQADRIDHLESAVENKSVLLESVRSVVDEKETRIDELEAENAKLETRLSAVEAELGVGGVTADASVADD
jgi:hypothetical protein